MRHSSPSDMHIPPPTAPITGLGGRRASSANGCSCKKYQFMGKRLNIICCIGSSFLLIDNSRDVVRLSGGQKKFVWPIKLRKARAYARRLIYLKDPERFVGGICFYFDCQNTMVLDLEACVENHKETFPASHPSSANKRCCYFGLQKG